MVFRLCIVVSLLVGAGAAQQNLGRVPEMHGTALDGNTVDLPEALKGKTAVLVLGFSQGSRSEITDWGRRLGTDYRNSNAVICYEMPVLESVPRLLRGWVTKKIGDAVPDQAKARFLPVMEHEAEWKQVAGFHAAGDAYVLVVDGTGIVRERVQGAATDEAYARVKAMVKRYQ